MARKELSALNVNEPVVVDPTPAQAPVRGLQVRNIARAFGARQVVRDVSLTVQRGEVAGLLGPNGAGKTTCFYMITGLIPADSGSIWLDGFAGISPTPSRPLRRIVKSSTISRLSCIC